jgi:flagellar basal body-associated protein FliL
MSGEPRDNSGNKTVLVVSIVGGIILVVVLACGGMAYLVVLGMRGFSQAMSSFGQQFAEMQNAMATAETFLDDFAQGQLDEAYAQTTKAYQQRVNREQFQALLDKHPAFKKATHDPLQPNNFNTATFRLTTTVTNPDGVSATCTLQLKKEDEQWKVDRFSIADEGEGQAGKGKQGANQAAKDFLDDVGAGRLDAAYARTSDDYKENTTREAFGALVAKHAGLKGFTSQNFRAVNVGPEQTTFTAQLAGPNGSVSCTVQLVPDDDGAWKVDRFSVP